MDLTSHLNCGLRAGLVSIGDPGDVARADTRKVHGLLELTQAGPKLGMKDGHSTQRSLTRVVTVLASRKSTYAF